MGAPRSAAAAGAQQRTRAHLAQRAAPAAAARLDRDPDIRKSNGGGANAILARGGIEEHWAERLRRGPEARWVHGVRLRDASWVVNADSEVTWRW